MRCSTSTLVHVTGTLDAVKDELLRYSGAYDLDDAVQMDIIDIEVMLDSNTLSSETTDHIIHALTSRKGDVYQFI